MIEMISIFTHTLQILTCVLYKKKYYKTNIDHVVLLKDALDNGAFNWP